MKTELGPEQEDEIYYGRMDLIIARVKSGELELTTPAEVEEIIKAFAIVRAI